MCDAVQTQSDIVTEPLSDVTMKGLSHIVEELEIKEVNRHELRRKRLQITAHSGGVGRNHSWRKFTLDVRI